jgi:hypothetical protein
VKTVHNLACSFGWWLVLICFERILLIGGWFVLREVLVVVADKQEE